MRTGVKVKAAFKALKDFHDSSVKFHWVPFVIYHFYLLFVPLFFSYLLDSVMPWHLFHVPYSVTNNLCYSVFSSSITPHSCICLLSLLLPLLSSIFQLLVPLFCFYLYLLNIHSLLFASPFQLCLLNILSVVTLWVIFYILHTTPFAVLLWAL